MTKKLLRITAEKIIKVAEILGFQLSHQTGSHKIYRNKNNQRITIPYHNKKILHPKTLKSILNDLGINSEDLKKLL